MAITTAICDSAKQEFLQGIHTASNVYKIALIKTGQAGTYNSGTTSYNNLTTDEVANGSGYTTGGQVLTNISYAITAHTASIDWDNPLWTNATISAEGALIYNDSVSGKPALGVFSFGGPVISTNGNFTVNIPATGVGVIRFA